MFAVHSKATSSNSVVAFPDVCKMPAPPAPFVPIPYPETQYRENMKTANKVDAMAKAGNKEAQAKKKQAIDNLYKKAGISVKSATQAVMYGRAVHNRPRSPSKKILNPTINNLR